MTQQSQADSTHLQHPHNREEEYAKQEPIVLEVYICPQHMEPNGSRSVKLHTSNVYKIQLIAFQLKNSHTTGEPQPVSVGIVTVGACAFKCTRHMFWLEDTVHNKQTIVEQHKKAHHY